MCTRVKDAVCRQDAHHSTLRTELRLLILRRLHFPVPGTARTPAVKTSSLRSEVTVEI